MSAEELYPSHPTLNKTNPHPARPSMGPVDGLRHRHVQKSREHFQESAEGEVSEGGQLYHLTRSRGIAVEF